MFVILRELVNLLTSIRIKESLKLGSLLLTRLLDTLAFGSGLNPILEVTCSILFFRAPALKNRNDIHIIRGVSVNLLDMNIAELQVELASSSRSDLREGVKGEGLGMRRSCFTAPKEYSI